MSSYVITQTTRTQNKWKIPQISWGIFAIISAITTSLGMCETFFDGDMLTGFAVAIGIQLLLIWMNKKITDLFFNTSAKALRALLILVYAVTVFWSTGFSFVYISNHVYSSVYMRDDQDLLIDSYQKSMINLNSYAEKDFNQYLDSIINEISSLQVIVENESNKVQTNISNEVPTLKVNFELLEEAFEKDYEMLQILTQCKGWGNGNPVGSTENLIIIIEDRLNQYNIEKSNLQADIKSLDSEIAAINNNITGYSEAKHHFKNGTTADYEYGQLIDEEQNKKSDLENQKTNLEEALNSVNMIIIEINALKSYVSFQNNSIDNMISNNFAQILTLLGQTTPDIEKANYLADEIYERLSEELQKAGDNSLYAEKLKAYLLLKQHLNQLQDIIRVQQFCQEENMQNVIASTEKLVTSYPSLEAKTQWKNLWNDAYTDIKSYYFQLPSANQREIQNICNNISLLQRNILTELNGIERSKYYLTCPHSFLAWLSLCLSLFLDTSPIIFMAVRKSHEKKQGQLAPAHPSMAN